MYLMALIDVTNDQNTMRGDTSGYIYIFNIKINIKDITL